MIEKFTSMAHGVGGSYTRWQGKPPAHAVFYAVTDEGQTAFQAYDLRDRFGEEEVKISGSDPMGPKDIPFKCDVPFGDLSEPIRDALKQRAVEHFEESDFFTDPDG